MIVFADVLVVVRRTGSRLLEFLAVSSLCEVRGGVARGGEVLPDEVMELGGRCLPGGAVEGTNGRLILDVLPGEHGKRGVACEGVVVDLVEGLDLGHC